MAADESRSIPEGWCRVRLRPRNWVVAGTDTSPEAAELEYRRCATELERKLRKEIREWESEVSCDPRRRLRYGSSEEKMIAAGLVRCILAYAEAEIENRAAKVVNCGPVGSEGADRLDAYAVRLTRKLEMKFWRPKLEKVNASRGLIAEGWTDLVADRIRELTVAYEDIILAAENDFPEAVRMWDDLTADPLCVFGPTVVTEPVQEPADQGAPETASTPQSLSPTPDEDRRAALDAKLKRHIKRAKENGEGFRTIKAFCKFIGIDYGDYKKWRGCKDRSPGYPPKIEAAIGKLPE